MNKLKKGVMYVLIDSNKFSFGTYLGAIGEYAVFRSSSFAADASKLNGAIELKNILGSPFLIELPLGEDLLTETRAYEFIQEVLP